MFGGGMAGYPGGAMMPSGYPDPAAAGGYGAFAGQGGRGAAGQPGGGRYGQQAGGGGVYGMPGMYGQAGAWVGSLKSVVVVRGLRNAVA
jgi:hypothetical protein